VPLVSTRVACVSVYPGEDVAHVSSQPPGSTCLERQLQPGQWVSCRPEQLPGYFQHSECYEYDADIRKS
jgi:hypothetical protein